MSIKEKKQEKKTSKGGAIAAAILLLLGAFDGLEGDGTAFAGVILVVVVFFTVVAIIGAANKKKKTAQPAVKAKKPAAKAAMPKAAPSAAPERKYYDSDCQKASSAHDHNRRLEQLDGFLKDGIISKAEYDILKAKYMR